jgi:hypothetical protein
MPFGLVVLAGGGGILLVASALVLGRRYRSMHAVPAEVRSSSRSAGAPFGRPAMSRYLAPWREQIASGARHALRTRRRVVHIARPSRGDLALFGFAVTVGIGIGVVAGLYL